MDPKDPGLWGPVCWDDQCSPHWPGQAGPLCSNHCNADSQAERVSVGWSASPLLPHSSTTFLGWDFALLSEDPPAVSQPGSWTLVQAGLAHPSCCRGQRGWGRRWGFPTSPRDRVRDLPLQCGAGGRVPKPVCLLLTFCTVNLVGHAVLLPPRRDPVWLHHPHAPARPFEVTAPPPVSVDKTL